MESYFIGFDPRTAAEHFDVVGAQRRLDEILEVRALLELVEKVGLFIALGRPEEARSTANEALRQARLGGDRAMLARAKVANARVLRAEGRNEQAVVDLVDVVTESEGYDQHDLLADALRQRALCRLALEEPDLARADFNEALAVLIHANAAPREIDTTMIAIGALLDRGGGGVVGVGGVEASEASGPSGASAPSEAE